MTNEEMIRGYADAWLAGDRAAMGSALSDDIALHLFGHSPLAGTHRGKEAVSSAIARVQELTNRQTLEIHDVFSGGDHAVILVKERFDDAGRSLDLSRVFLYDIRDGKITDIYVYDEDQALVDSFWS